MLDRIRVLLVESGCDGWRMVVKESDGAQGYFVSDRLEMIRAQDIVEINVVLYKDFMEEGEQFRGSVNLELYPTMTDREILQKIEFALKGASAVKNKWYPLPDPRKYKNIHAGYVSQFAEHDVFDWINLIADDVYRNHSSEVDFNAAEIFLSKDIYHFVNSEGLEHSWTAYSGLAELVAAARGVEEAVEIFHLFSFSDYSRSWIDEKVKMQISLVRDRAKSIYLPVSGVFPVVLKGNAVFEFFDYFRYQSTAEAIFQGTSVFRKGKSLQNGNGDPLTISIVPYIARSPYNTVVDTDGIRPEEVVIIENGVVKDITADIQFGTYLREHVTGMSRNIKVAPGTMKTLEFGDSPYLEAVEFSDFTVDRITGDFGGEIRLAYYFDGTTRRPVTGGSLTGSIGQNIDTLRMAEKTITDGSYSGPEFLYFSGVSITGID